MNKLIAVSLVALYIYISRIYKISIMESKEKNKNLIDIKEAMMNCSIRDGEKQSKLIIMIL